MAGIPFWLQNVIGNSARAGLIAAGSPTPGAVGTIRDAVGGLQAAEADQQQRFDRMEMMRRAAMQDRYREEQMAMEREQNEATLEYRRAQKASEEAQRDRALRPEKTPDGYIEFRKRAMAEGITDEDQIMSAWMKQPYKRNPPQASASSKARNPMEYARQLMEENDTLSEPSMTAFFDPAGQRAELNQRIIDKTLGVPTPKPQAPPRPPATAEAALVADIQQRIDELKKLGTPQAMAQVAQLQKELRSIMAAKKAEQRPSTEVEWKTTDDGMEEAVVIDKTKTGPTGIRRKPRSTGNDTKSQILEMLRNRRPGGGGNTSKKDTLDIRDR